MGLSFTPHSLYLWWKSTRHSLSSGLGCPHSQSGCFREHKNLLLLLRMKWWIPSSPTYNRVTTQLLSWLPIKYTTLVQMRLSFQNFWKFKVGIFSEMNTVWPSMMLITTTSPLYFIGFYTSYSITFTVKLIIISQCNRYIKHLKTIS